MASKTTFTPPKGDYWKPGAEQLPDKLTKPTRQQQRANERRVRKIQNNGYYN